MGKTGISSKKRGDFPSDVPWFLEIKNEKKGPKMFHVAKSTTKIIEWCREGLGVPNLKKTVLNFASPFNYFGSCTRKTPFFQDQVAQMFLLYKNHLGLKNKCCHDVGFGNREKWCHLPTNPPSDSGIIENMYQLSSALASWGSRCWGCHAHESMSLQLN